MSSRSRPPGRRAAAAALLLGLVLPGCSDRPAAPAVVPGVTEPGPPSPAATTYRVAPPAGKLPWPQHAPSFGAGEHDAMVQQLHVGSNFGLYQPAATRDSSYLHDGLDILLPNGTPVYAVEAGTVRFVQPGSDRFVVVEDADEPGLGWGYVHVDDIRVAAGDRVAQGTRLASVRFAGLDHLHLSRYRLPEGGRWDRVLSLVTTQPDTFFAYRDTQQPLIAAERFRYFRNESDSAFAGGAPTVISGDVDLVVGVRDPGEYAREVAPGALVRNAPSRLEYDVVGPGGDTLRFQSWNLTAQSLGPRGARGAEHVEAETVVKPTVAVERAFGARTPAGFTYYVLTNVPAGGRTGRFERADAALAWRTAERGADGRPRFPNGDYVVTVRALDFRGNRAVRSDTVRVRN